MPMKKDPSQVLAAYNALSVVDRKDPGKLAQFVSTYFAEAGSDIMSVTPKDFSPNPSFLDGIEDGPRRLWARAIHGLWPLLVRANAADVAVNPQRHSLLPRQHPVVVPGGRFRESYYWDTFWTIRGLVVSGMVDTARGAVLNLLDDVDRFGFVPNGGRLYYTERSQPPLLSDMVCEVYSARPDRAFLARALPSLEAEHAFWMNFERGRAVCVPALPPPLKTFDAMLHGVTLEGAAVLLNRYWGALDPPPAAGVGDTAGGKGVTGPLLSRPPRPESFREDTEVSLEQQHQCCCGGGNSCASDAVRGCKSYSGGEDRDRPADAGDIAGDVASGAATSGTPGAVDSDSAGIADHEAAGLSGACHELAAAAESGWDFSSRWAGLSSRGRSASTAASSGDRDKSTSSMEGEDGEDEEEGDAFRLSATATTSVVPVDLNAFLHRVELNIARLHHALAGNPTDRKEPASSETPDDPTPPTMPPLLSLDEIQRRFLSRRRGSTKSWSSMSSTLMEKLTRQGELEFGSEEADMTSPTASGGGDGRLGLESRALSRKVMLFAAAARARAKAMEQTMWDGRSALWRDLLLPTGDQSQSATPACLVPMWSGSRGAGARRRRRQRYRGERASPGAQRRSLEVERSRAARRGAHLSRGFRATMGRPQRVATLAVDDHPRPAKLGERLDSPRERNKVGRRDHGGSSHRHRHPGRETACVRGRRGVFGRGPGGVGHDGSDDGEVRRR
ncbi:unnamed protein product [Ectocarpus sp. 12 AP-2014]